MHRELLRTGDGTPRRDRAVRHLSTAEGVVRRAALERDGLWRLTVEVGDRLRQALLLEQFTPPAAPGDRVVLNTTAVDLGLGTGGFDFVVHVVGKVRRSRAPGHIMKLRYTPAQLPVLAAEEVASPHHEVLKARTRLSGMPVVIAALHSQLAPAAAALRLGLGPKAIIVYVMTDGAALPVAFSETVKRLRNAGVLNGAVTVGHAFGGDLEAVTLFSGLLAARWALGGDAAIVAVGPGVVGTGTPFGTTAVEAGQHSDAVVALGGQSIVAPRLSFADPRTRHFGVSHHTLTAFGVVAQRRATLVLPRLSDQQRSVVLTQLLRAGIFRRHDVREEERGREALDFLAADGVPLRSMGRDVRQDEAPFLAAAAAGFVAADLVRSDRACMSGRPRA